MDSRASFPGGRRVLLATCVLVFTTFALAAGQTPTLRPSVAAATTAARLTPLRASRQPSAPAAGRTRRVFQENVGLDRIDAYAQRVRRTHGNDPGRQREFDYVASAGDLLLVNETKSTIRPEDIPAFVTVLEEARDYLPEAEGHAVIGALAGFSVDPSLIAAGERQGLLMFGLGTGLLRVLNAPGFRPGRF